MLIISKYQFFRIYNIKGQSFLGSSYFIRLRQDQRNAMVSLHDPKCHRRRFISHAWVGRGGGVVDYGRVVAERERKRKNAHTYIERAFTLGMRITGGWKKTREGKRRVKSRSPCAACGSKTRSSFLHLQVEYRDILAALIVVIVIFRFSIFLSLASADCRFRLYARPIGNHCKGDGGNCFT